MHLGSRDDGAAALIRQAAAGNTTALRHVLASLMAAKPQKLSTMIQVRVTDDAAQRLDSLVARIDEQTGMTVTRSDLVRMAVDALTND